jgi:hypothetical protein
LGIKTTFWYHIENKGENMKLSTRDQMYAVAVKLGDISDQIDSGHYTNIDKIQRDSLLDQYYELEAQLEEENKYAKVWANVYDQELVNCTQLGDKFLDFYATKQQADMMALSIRVDCVKFRKE